MNFTAAEKKDLSESGLEIVGYLPPTAYIVEAKKEVMAAYCAANDVLYCAEYLPEYKSPSKLSTKLLSATSNEIMLRLTSEKRLAEIKAFLETNDVTNIRELCSNPPILTAVVSFSLIEKLKKHSGVLRLETPGDPQLSNFAARRADMLNIDPAQETFGLKGKGQTIGIVDTGLDGGIYNMHPDFDSPTRKIRGAIVSSSTKTSWQDDNGHGTHVAGSAAGAGTSSGGAYAGVAPQADLFILNIQNQGSSVLLPAYTDLFNVYTSGVHVINNSWGDSDPDTYGAYTAYSELLDNLIYNNQDLLLVFAAGNNNESFSYANNCTISPQASSKNVLTVAAAECHKDDVEHTYYSLFRWPDEPYKSDKVTVPNDGVHQGMAAFSSRGPTHDLRVKPDVAAPGTMIISCASIFDKTSNPKGTREISYRFMSGTSQATPFVSGSAILLREFLEKNKVTNPSAALLKALLINGTRSLGTGQFAGRYEIPEEDVNCVSGYGHVNFLNSIAPTNGTKLIYLEGLVTNSGELVTYKFKKEESGPLHVTLCWSDYPATAGAGMDLVNDLDVQIFIYLLGRWRDVAFGLCE